MSAKGGSSKQVSPDSQSQRDHKMRQIPMQFALGFFVQRKIRKVHPTEDRISQCKTIRIKKWWYHCNEEIDLTNSGIMPRRPGKAAL